MERSGQRYDFSNMKSCNGLANKRQSQHKCRQGYEYTDWLIVLALQGIPGPRYKPRVSSFFLGCASQDKAAPEADFLLQYQMSALNFLVDQRRRHHG